MGGELKRQAKLTDALEIHQRIASNLAENAILDHALKSGMETGWEFTLTIKSDPVALNEVVVSPL